MRHVLVSSSVLLLAALTAGTPNLFAEFVEPLLHEPDPVLNNDTIVEHVLELVKRQNTCATGYNACVNLNAPGLCCRADTVCSQDNAGHVACCPQRAACTGTIGNVNGQPTVTQITTTGNPFQPTATGTTTSNNFFPLPTTNSFIQSGTVYIPTTINNPFYPFVVIPTTYTNAAACSSAYTSCQGAASSCFMALESGVQGITVSAPNGGATITAIASVGPVSASSICQSLSSVACSGLTVEACQAFGTGIPNQNAGAGKRDLCGRLYGVGAAAAAVGIAGQLMR